MAKKKRTLLSFKKEKTSLLEFSKQICAQIVCESYSNEENLHEERDTVPTPSPPKKKELLKCDAAQKNKEKNKETLKKKKKKVNKKSFDSARALSFVQSLIDDKKETLTNTSNSINEEKTRRKKNCNLMDSSSEMKDNEGHDTLKTSCSHRPKRKKLLLISSLIKKNKNVSPIINKEDEVTQESFSSANKLPLVKSLDDNGKEPFINDCNDINENKTNENASPLCNKEEEIIPKYSCIDEKMPFAESIDDNKKEAFVNDCNDSDENKTGEVQDTSVIDLTQATDNVSTVSDIASGCVDDDIEIILENVKPKSFHKLNNKGIRDGNNDLSGTESRKRKLDDSLEICSETYVIQDSETPAKRPEISKDVSSTESNISSVVKNICDDVICINSNEQPSDIILLEPLGKIGNYKKTKEPRPKKEEYSSPQVKWSYFPKKSAQQIKYDGKYEIFSVSDDSFNTDAINEQPECSSYHNVNGNNMYNPNGVIKTGLRPIIIDGSNVAYGHGRTNFSIRGLVICIQYFLKLGHRVVAFVPLYRRNEATPRDRDLLDSFNKKGQLVFTPSRYLNGRRVVPYDDRYIVQCAAELGGVIVSTDNYRDLINENAAWRETIEKRLLMFTWVGDLLMFPNDPIGRDGPTLEEYLRFP